MTYICTVGSTGMYVQNIKIEVLKAYVFTVEPR